MSFQIITDTCCDFTDEQYKALGIDCVPLSVMWDDEVHKHFSTEEKLKEFYKLMRRGVVATTSALNPNDWAETMEPHLKQGEDLLVLSVSSGISTTFQSAVIAAEELRETYPERTIRVVDSLGGSLGEGLLAMHACRMREEGKTLTETATWLTAHADRVCHWVTVDDLSNLKRSGRLSSASSFVGTLLDIKPIIRVTEEGTLVSDGKTRGRKCSIRMLAQRFGAHWNGDPNDPIAIAHGDCKEDAEALSELLRSQYGVKHIHIGMVGPILGAHTGAGVLAVFHIGTKR